MARQDQYSLLLLAGGRNARMGAVKAELLYEGKTFLEHMLDKARHLGIRDFYISGYESPLENVRTLPDHFSDRGPLGGVHAGLRAIRTPYCLVLPVDAPKLPPEILEELICQHEKRTDEQVLIWEHGVRQEPLIAIYPAAMADTIENLIREHSAAVFHALDVWGYRRFRRELEEDLVLNVNTPQAYNRLLGLEGYVSKAFFAAYYQRYNWQGRMPRAKQDVVNATLDIGYTILFNFIECYVRMFGFDVYIGVYHRLWFKRKSLICDLVEPFRCIIDRTIRTAFNRKQFSPNDFISHKGEYKLKIEKNAEYHKIFFDALIVYKMEIFDFIRSYYRCFMNGKDITQYPKFTL